MRIDSGCVDEPKFVFQDNQRLLAYSTILKGKGWELFSNDAREGYHKKGEACVVNMQSLRLKVIWRYSWVAFRRVAVWASYTYHVSRDEPCSFGVDVAISEVSVCEPFRFDVFFLWGGGLPSWCLERPSGVLIFEWSECGRNLWRGCSQMNHSIWVFCFWWLIWM